MAHTFQAQCLQRSDAAGLQQLTHDPIGFLEALLEQEHAAALLAQGDGDGAADDAGPDHDDVGFMVQDPPSRGRVGRICFRRRCVHLVEPPSGMVGTRLPHTARRDEILESSIAMSGLEWRQKVDLHLGPS